MNNSRRSFLSSTGSFALGLMGLKTLSLSGKQESNHLGYGKLVKDEKGILDLPPNFRYRIIGKVGDQMSDGFFLPDKPDGMATSILQSKRSNSLFEIMRLIQAHRLKMVLSGTRI